MTESEFKKLLDAAEKSPREIAAAVSGLPEKVLKYKPAPAKWSILEILAHLVDMETLYAYRMRQIVADKTPVLAPIDQDDWARNLGYMDENPAELVALYGLNRHHNVGLLRRLKAGDLDKTAMHPELNKQVPLWDYVQKMGVHGPNHLKQIEQLKREATKTKSA
ncbi:MAG TPA: DinB family protein [Terriglobales bacterium]|jgi:DinB superfamily|nr:DinB family protein [Terriglobales bacterium]